MLFLRGLGLWAVLPLLSPSLLPSSVPNLEEAVPRAGGNGHAVCRHPQAAHSVVMARKDSYGGKEERSGKEAGSGRDEGVDHAEDTHRRLRTYTPAYRAVCSCTACYKRYVTNKNKHAGGHLCMAYDQHPRDWPKNNVLGKVWLAEPSYNRFHPGAMVGLRKDGVLDKTEKQ